MRLLAWLPTALALGLVTAPAAAERAPTPNTGSASVEPRGVDPRAAPSTETAPLDFGPGIGGGPPSTTPRIEVRFDVGARSGLPGFLVPRDSVMDMPSPSLILDLGGFNACTLGQDDGPPLDQLSREILRNLADRDVTVVWLLDESASMEDDRKALEEKFHRVASELKVNSGVARKAARALDHAVVGFGERVDFALREPTRDLAAVGRAIDQLRPDRTGVENTFHAVQAVVDEYGRRIAPGRRLLVVLATDESGDDGDYLEAALRAATARGAVIYVLGREALFGSAWVRLHRPDQVAGDDDLPAIRRGPETADVETFPWDGLHERRDEQPSGFAPYELARLCKETGGIYFLLPGAEEMRVHRREQAYSMAKLREYAPDYDSRAVYLERRGRSDLRRGLHEIIQEARTFSTRLRFPVESGRMVEAVARADEEAGRHLGALAGFETKLRALQENRDREPEPRWRANYDLMLAQVVASQVKLHEYLACLRELIEARAGPVAVPTPTSEVSWVLDHSRQRHDPGDRALQGHVEAERLLKRVVERHPQTPWADLAQATLDRGLGVQRRESHRAPIPSPGGRAGLVPKF